MKFRVVPLPQVTSVEAAKWQELAESGAEPNPNADPRFLLPSLSRGMGADELLLLIVESGQEYRLVLPCTREPRLSGLPLAHLSTAGKFLYQHASKVHPLISAESPTQAFAALFDGLRSAGLPDLLDQTVLPVDSVVHSALAELAATGRVRLVERGRDRRAYVRYSDLALETGAVARSGTEDSVSLPVAHMSSRHRRTIRGNARKLETLAAGGLELADVSGQPQAIKEFFELQANGWKGQPGFDGPLFRFHGLEDWFTDVAARFESDGNLRTFRLSAAGKTVYLAVILVSGGRPFGFHDVYAEEYRKFSAGSIGRLAVLGRLFEAPDAPPFDPGMEPWYKEANALMGGSREYAHVVVAGRSLTSRAVIKALPLAKAARDRWHAASAPTP